MSKWFERKVGVTLFAMLLSLLLAGHATSASTVQLYSERVVVSQNADQQEQDEAIESSFRRLLVRVTGVEEILLNPAISAELENGKRYLASFRFDSSDVFFTNILGEQVPTKTMVLDFDKTSVNELLVRNGLPVWGEKRPDVMIWIADRLTGSDHILSSSENSEMAKLLNEHADRRGIPYILPIMDLNDTLALSFADLYGLFSADIEQASERYQPEAVLAGRIQRSGDVYSADWMLLFKNERLRLPTVSGSLSKVLAEGINLASGRLSEQYALLLDPDLIGTYQIKVTDIADLQDFTALENYLRSINVITQVSVSRFENNDVIFNVQLSGDNSQLADLLALDQRLTPVQESSLIDQLDNLSIYRWNNN